MEAKELRIGNYINVDSIPYEQVTQIFTDGVVTEAYEIVNSWNDIEPIPLTEEWLLKFGFEKDTYNNEFELGEYTLYKYPDEWALSVDFNNVEVAFIHYVHQLQNLYHALGEELTIKE